MEITTTTTTQNANRRAAVNALAVVGFIALLLIGIGLAIYSARFIPETMSRLGAAAVDFSSVFVPAEGTPELEVIVATTTLPFAESATTTVAIPESPAPASPAPAAPAYTPTYTVVTTVTEPIAPYGDPDLTVRITDVGYLRTSSTNSFVSSRTVRDGERGAVKFTVTNTGTNVTGSWKFRAEIPTSPAFTYTSPTQRSLNPGDRIDFILGFTDGREGDNREITITVDSGRDVRESDERNNEDSARVDIDN